MSWLDAWGAIAASAGWLFVPGALLGIAARLRGLALWALAPVLSTFVLAALAVLYGAMDVTWGPWTAAGGTIAVALIVWGFRALLRPGVSTPGAARGAAWLVPAGIGVGAILTFLRLVLYIGGPENVSQTNDAVFHLNALRYIVESGSASSLELSQMLGAATFYPAAWHAPTSLVVMMGADVVVAANAMSVVIGSGVWTLGLAWLVLVVTRGNRLAAGSAGALAAAMAAFPLLMIQWGVLYPSLLAIAVLPAAIASVVDLPSRWSTRGWREVTWGGLLAAAAVLGVGLSQPSILVAWIIAAANFGIWLVIASWRSASVRRRLALAATVLVGGSALAGIWLILSRFVTSEWPSSRGRVAAAIDIVLNGQVGFAPAWGVSLLMAVGLVIAIRTPRLRWLATAWVMISGLYFVAVAVGNPAVRSLLAPFYGDPYRVAAIVPVFVIPLAAIGVSALSLWVSRALARRRQRPSPPTASPSVGAWSLGALATAGALGLVIAPVIQWRDVWTGRTDRVTWYTIADDTYLTADERALLSRLDSVVPEGELIVGNPSTGMAFGFALGDRDVYPLSWQPPRTQPYEVLAARMNAAATDPEVCAAIDALGARFVLDFGPGETQYGRYLLPGFTDIAGREGFELVDREGDAALYRITACS